MLQRFALPTALAVLLGACAHPAQTRSATTDAPQIELLGEVHDNAAGHAARVAVLRARLDAGWRPAIAMEQFDTGQQAALDAAMRDCADADCVVTRVVPGRSGWTWDYYKPVIALALEFHLPLYAANLSRAEATKVVKDGFAAALPAAVVARYGLDDLPQAVLKAQEAEVRSGHCGMLPEALVPAMARAQIARDVVMADTLRTHAGNGIVLIAGNGHTRGDIAVAYWLRHVGLAAHAVGFLESANADESGHYDATHRIPTTERPDPCAQFQPPQPGR